MNHPFIRNHQYNLIKKQLGLLQRTCNTVADPKVVQSVRDGVQANVLEAFPEAAGEQRQYLERIYSLSAADEFQSYLSSLEPYLEEFPRITDNQLKKLFPKVKKLKTPNMAELDFRYITYLGWTDIAANKMFLAYQLDNRLVGIEGRFTPAHKKGVCFLCNRHEEVALFTAVTKSRPANASPDYYKAIGNYMCANSDACNQNMTSVEPLEKFFRAILEKS